MSGILYGLLGIVAVSFSVVAGIVLVVSRLFMKGFWQGDSEEKAQETRMVQELYNGLTALEERMDTLETIFMENDSKK